MDRVAIIRSANKIDSIAATGNRKAQAAQSRIIEKANAAGLKVDSATQAGIASAGVKVAGATIPGASVLTNALGAASGRSLGGKGAFGGEEEAQSDTSSTTNSAKMRFLELQNAIQAEASMFQTMSSVSKAAHDTLKSIINNIRA